MPGICDGSLTGYGMVGMSFRPQAGQALPLPVDEKEAKILSKRTLRRAF